jgi:tetratricopeptide (TPR) repeat protein
MTVRRVALILGSALIVVSVLASVWMIQGNRQSSPREDVDPEYARFMQMASDGNEAQALELGDSLFKTLLDKKPGNPTLALLTNRLSIAEQISVPVTNSVRSNQPKLLEGIQGMGDLGLPPRRAEGGAAPASLLPPAREVYWTRLKAFTDTPVSSDLSTQQFAFCQRHYDLRMQDLSVKIGRQIVVTDPNSSENVCHALVLPLLYLHGRDDDWEQAEPLLALFSPAMLDVLSKFTLLQIERPQAAMAVAQYRAGVMGKEFSPIQWGLEAADACAANHRPDLAEQLLGMIIARIGDQDQAAQLQLKIIESYAQCRDYDMASQACEHILVGLSDVSLCGRIKVMRLGYLARENKVEQVIAETELAPQDPAYKPHLAQVLYLRWWALGKANRPEEAVQIAGQLMEQYANDPYVAPILLERATDALARQEYERCRELLTRLTTDFPDTESAKRAGDILSRLKGSLVE